MSETGEKMPGAHVQDTAAICPYCELPVTDGALRLGQGWAHDRCVVYELSRSIPDNPLIKYLLKAL